MADENSGGRVGILKEKGSSLYAPPPGGAPWVWISLGELNGWLGLLAG